MVEIPDRVRSQLKRPLGKLYKDFREIKKLSRDHHIIAIGDVCTLGLLAMGIKPHLAVFDFHFMRHELDSGIQSILKLYYKKPARYRNPAGTISERILKDAPKLLRKGGGVYIEGEEDLTALAFIRSGGPKDVIVYGQPHVGMVVVKPDAKIKKRVERWLSAASLGHEI
jgi:uncharacterized protein (UPF0218 family)